MAWQRMLRPIRKAELMTVRSIHAFAPVIESKGVTRLADQKRLCQFNELDIEIVSVFLDKGPVAVDNDLDDVFAVPDMVTKAMALEETGATAGVIINCMADPGLRAMRCALGVPVIGAGEIAMHFAATLGGRFGIIDVGGDTGPMVDEQVARYGLTAKYAGTRSTGIAAEEIPGQTNAIASLFSAAHDLVMVDGAHVLVLGCTGFMGVAGEISDALREKGIDVPVVDPTAIAVRTMIAMVREGIGHSKRAFPSPRPKGLRGYTANRHYRSA